ncbi:MAG: DUF4349 domain-containing protein [Myxococcota bacterium]
MLFAWLWVLCARAVDVDAAIPQRTEVVATVLVSVPDRDVAGDAIVADAEARGGWFAERTPDTVVTRIPVEAVEAHLEAVAAQGRVLGRTLERTDVSRDLATLGDRIGSRREVLARYDREGATASSLGAVISVQQRVDATIGEIEQLRGQEQVLADRAGYARVEVAFRFRDRSGPVVRTTSPFPWVGALSLPGLVAAVRGGGDWRPVRGPVPAGFASWGRARATSPDGVVWRVRRERHRPAAALGFWEEAVREHLVACGYTLVGSAPVEVGGRTGVVLELAAPVGEEDWGWLVAVIPDGRQLVVAEAAGELPRLEARREAVVAAIGGLRLP